MARVVHHIKRQEANARQAIRARHRDYDSFKDLVLREWNTSGTGFLDQDEVAQWMDDMNIDVLNRKPEKYEIEYVIMEGNNDRKDSQGERVTYRTLEEKIIAPEYFGRAADAWLEYQDSIQQIEAIFNKFDLDGDKVLNKQELQVFLTDLNELKPVSDADVETVLNESDILGYGYIVPINLPKAIASWYALDRKKLQEHQSKLCCVS